jgi:hypothetical protein
MDDRSSTSSVRIRGITLRALFKMLLVLRLLNLVLMIQVAVHTLGTPSQMVSQVKSHLPALIGLWIDHTLREYILVRFSQLCDLDL